ncbi:MAG: cyclic nucleotide-binding domain-containing protein [Myxococcota bacterium]|nr:cyclic nucleotide-binding domain-containing protein [Myxococcota bacterium]
MLTDTEASLWSPPSNDRDQEPSALEALRAVPLFSDLKNSELKRLLRIMHDRTYQSGEVIFREGDLGAGMFIIKRGAVSIVITLPGGAEREITRLTERQFFGEIALLEDAPRSASAVATERTEVLGFFEPDLEGLMERDTKLGSRVLWQLARLMATRLRTTNESLRAQRQTDGR